MTFSPEPLAISRSSRNVAALPTRITMVCGNPANHTQRLVASEDRVLVGSQGMYEARCRRCFDPMLTQVRAADERGSTVASPPGPERETSKANV